MSKSYTSITNWNRVEIGSRKIISWPVEDQLGGLFEKINQNSKKGPFGCEKTQKINPIMNFESSYLSWE